MQHLVLMLPSQSFEMVVSVAVFRLALQGQEQHQGAHCRLHIGELHRVVRSYAIYYLPKLDPEDPHARARLFNQPRELNCSMDDGLPILDLGGQGGAGKRDAVQRLLRKGYVFFVFKGETNE